MSPSRALTKAFLDSVRPIAGRQVDYFDAKVPGLIFRVSPAGTKSWGIRYRNIAGEQRRFALGRYPAVSLSKARERALKLLGDVAEGRDPSDDKRKAKAEAAARNVFTVSDLVRSYLTDAAKGRHKPDGRPKRASTLKNERDHFDRFLKERFGNLAIEELTRNSLQTFFDDLSDSTPSAARECRNIVRQAYNYAIRRDLTKTNPAQFALVAKAHSRDRVLSDTEMERLWTAFGDTSENIATTLSKTMGLALRFSMVTLQRGNEVCGLHDDEIDIADRIWSIPGERTKNHRTHLVPLSDMAIAIIEESRSVRKDGNPYLFPSPRTMTTARNGEPAWQPITRHAFSRACKRVTKTLGIENATPHDFRRTGATNLTGERIGIPRFHVSKVLNHISAIDGAKVTGSYDRNDYLSEKRRALDAWSALLSEIVSGHERKGNIVQLIK